MGSYTQQSIFLTALGRSHVFVFVLWSRKSDVPSGAFSMKFTLEQQECFNRK